MEIQEKLLMINSYSRSGEKQNAITNIVVHWVGNANSSAIANRNYFENLKDTKTTYASSHLIVGLDGEIIRCIPDDEVAFHSGSYSMNRKSIGIETCHPDWEGKFAESTYNSLVELCAKLCKTYNLDTSAIIRHYDVTEKNCPKYYVENNSEWIKFKSDVAIKMGTEVVEEINVEGSDEEVRVYKNGSTTENVYADVNLTNKIGSLNKYEQCDCLGTFNNRAIVRYVITGSTNYKIGFVEWLGGVQ